MNHLQCTMPLSSSTTTTTTKPHKPTATTAATTAATATSQCKNHTPSATLDILILIPVLISIAFLLISYFSYLFNSLSLLLPPSSLSLFSFLSLPYIAGFSLLFAASLVCLFCPPRSRKCSRIGCKGLKKALEFDLQIQTEERLKSNNGGGGEYSNELIDSLPYKGGSEKNAEYERLRNELRKMAPPNGRAVLLFRAPCGCPVSKLEGWAPKKSRRHKK